jgi:RHS repeat-associated protein
MQIALKNSAFSYPFGSLKASRNASTSNYRFSFNGQEGTDELSGVGNHTTATFWEYDTRLGRRWNLDPVIKYGQSGYSTFANNPIWFIDPNGADSLKFDAGGMYTGQVKAEGDHVGQLADGTTFSFADQSWGDKFTTDEYPQESDGKGFNSIFVVPDKDIAGILEGSGVNDKKNIISKYYYALTESRGNDKKMDFVNNSKVKKMVKENRYSLFMTKGEKDNMAHDTFNFGNFMWGAGMSKLKIPYIDAVIGGYIDNMYHHGLELDSKDDQRSIKAGYKWNYENK